ncbi:MAG: ABC transporter ATP-binding protein [Deltaproteobacteria bacterium]|nr:ABC transporter ATP-binding protein [Deltaproteobacteria bacterium]
MIKTESLTKTFRLYNSPADILKELLFGKKYHTEFHALKNVSFEVPDGQALGIIGQNGAGKSTLLKILNGVILPDSGTHICDGKTTGLLELGTGFNPEMTGLQNIYMNGLLLGMSREEIDQKKAQMIAFTELGDFITKPLKTYSSGMVMRLAFSVAIHAEPKCFLVDEALSVGDAYFQQKCSRKIKKFRDEGGSIIFVSHDLNAVKILCNQAVLLDHGEVVDQGDPEQVINLYNYMLAKKTEKMDTPVCQAGTSAEGYGNFQAKIVSLRMLNDLGDDVDYFVSGKPTVIEIDLISDIELEDITVGILIRDRFGQDVFGTNTFQLKVPIKLQSGSDCTVRYRIDEFNLGAGKYTLTVAAHSQAVHIDDCYHWIDNVKSFEVLSATDFLSIGLVRLKPEVELICRGAGNSEEVILR